MSSIDTAAGRISYLEAGEHGEATPILFLHGVGSDKRVWRPQLDHFGASRRAIAADYPGYGESDLQPGAGHDEYASAMAALLDALGIERVHLCGLSLGGVVAIAMASLYPQRCASLVIADSFAIHPEGEAIHDRSLAAAKDVGMRALAEARVDALIAPGAPEGLREEVIETMAGIAPEAYALGARAVWLADQRGRVEALALPTLVVCGTHDSITPPLLSIRLAETIRGARLAMIEGAGHLANAERPAAFNRVVEEFISVSNA